MIRATAVTQGTVTPPGVLQGAEPGSCALIDVGMDLGVNFGKANFGVVLWMSRKFSLKQRRISIALMSTEDKM